MKTTGYLLIAGAFLAGSLLGTMEVLEVNWVRFVPVLLAGFAGAVLVRLGSQQESQSEDVVKSNIETIHRSLESVIGKVQKLNGEKAQIHPCDMRHRIDDTLLVDLDDFIEARESIGHKYGLQHYADIMSHFAAGERYLNRVWSASVDGYVDEINTYMDKAEEQFAEAFGELKKLEAGGGA